MPGRYPVPVLLAEKLGWTWDDIRQAPSDLIDELLVHWAAKDRWSMKRSELEQAKTKVRR